MSLSPKLGIWAVLLGVSLAGLEASRAEPPPGKAEPAELLLLRNGQVLKGKVTREGDRFHVELDSGRVWIKAVDVELHCRSLEEGYWLKRQAMPLGNVHGHLDLAQWCLHHDLMGHAASELRDALAVDPYHPRIELLERRLKLAQQAAPPTKGVDAAPSSAPSADELDRLLRGLPAGAVETFTTSIQPLLVNNCTAAGCHGPAAERGPRWSRVSTRAASRRLTQRNLHTTLELVNREKPHESPLLLVPTQPHGGSAKPVFFDLQSSQYRMLVAWVQQISTAPIAPQPTSVVAQTPPLMQTMPAAGVQQVNFETPLPAQAEKNKPAGAEAANETPDDLPAEVVAPPQIRVGPGLPPPRETPTRGEVPTPFRPKDPFDPQIFNRRFFPEGKK